MRPLTTPIVDKAAYGSGETKQIEINVPGYITQVDVDISLNVTAASSVTPKSDDELLRVIKSLKLTASGAPDFISFRDGREAWWLSYLKSEGQAYADSAPSAGATEDVVIQFSIHPGRVFSDPFDKTRIIPMRGLTNVVMEVQWGSDSDLGTGFTINSGEMKITVYHLVLDKGEREDEAFPGVDHLMRPRYLPVTYSIDGVYASYGFSQNIPTGAYIRDVMLLILNSSDLRTNTDVSQFNVSDNKGETRIKHDDWVRYLRRLRQQLKLPAALTGVGMVFFKEIEGKEYGLNMVGASLGDYTINFTTTATGGYIHALYEAADMISIDPTEVGR